ESDSRAEHLVDLAGERATVVVRVVVDRQAGGDAEPDVKGVLARESTEPVQRVVVVVIAPGVAMQRVALRCVHVVRHAAVVAEAHHVGPFVPRPGPAVEALDDAPDVPRHTRCTLRAKRRAGSGLSLLRSRRNSGLQQARWCRRIASGRMSRTLSEAESKRLLRDHGVPILVERVVTTPEEAVDAATELGYPVVAKLCGDAIAHKTERGLVRLDLTDADQVASAARDL